nr:hypothetical protein [uncultured Oscillibacter sp.]
MSDAVLVALIGLAGSGLGSVLGILVSSKLTQYRLEQLEKKVEVHNKVIDRVYKLEERTELQEEKIKVANHRIDDLENFHKPGQEARA